MSLRTSLRQLRRSWSDSGPLWTATLIADRLAPGSALGLWPVKRVEPAVLARQVESVLRAWGMSPEHAATTVEHVLYADLRGIDSHGCSMLLDYHGRFRAGTLTMTPVVSIVREDQTTALIDGGGGLGHVVADRAMKWAMTRCRESGLAAVAVRNSGHYGAAGAYALMAAQAGLIGIATTNTRSPAVVPTFGAEAMLGTNPIAFAAPTTRNQPFVLDMATSTVPLGRLAMAWRRGRPIPAGWALATDSSPITNAKRAMMERRLTPLGGTPDMASHKGYGLAVVVSILSSLLSDAPSGDGDQSGVGHFFLAIDPRRFGAPGTLESGLDALIDSLHACRPLEARRPVLVAGDPEYATMIERQRSGIPLSRAVVEDLRSVAHASGVAFVLDGKG